MTSIPLQKSSSEMAQICHWIQGKPTAGSSVRQGALINPSTGKLAGHITYANGADVDQAVKSAQTAFESWSLLPASTRANHLFRWRYLIESHAEEIANIISKEHGKSLVEARGSLSRGMDVLSYACGIPAQLKGEFSENVGRGVDAYAIRQPLGVCVGITPFNFPAMIPLWTASVALACGNTFIIKPSEKTPSCAYRLAELASEAGIPDGVLNVVHGDREAVEALIDHPQVKAISFVGQTPTARAVQQRAISNGKRVQAFGGAKNHMLVMPDADLTQTIEGLIGSAFGSAGERCMAISVAVIVGDKLADKIVKALEERIPKIQIGSYLTETAELTPLITEEHLGRVKEYIEIGLNEGAQLVIDGRKLACPNEGHFLGASVFDHVKENMRIYQEEIFGPVLSIVRVADYEAGLKLINEHPYGNGVSLFTRDGDTARDFAQRVQIGMVGINVPIPVPVGYHSFGGWKQSSFSDIGMHGPEGIRFYTKLKTVTSRWPSGIRSGIEYALPTTE